MLFKRFILIPKDGNRVYLAFIILIGLGLRLFQLGHDSLWNDEAGVVLAALSPTIQGTIDTVRTHVMAMPLDYLVIRGVARISLHEFVLRLPSAIFGSLALIVCYRLFRRLYPGKSDRDPSQEPLRVNAEYLLDPFYPWTWWQTARRIAEWEPDVVILQWWTTFWAPAFAALSFLLRRRGIKVLFVIHNVMPHEPRPWDRWLARLALRQGHHFLVQTVREKERLLSLLPQAQTISSPHPVYDMFANQRIPAAKAKQQLGLPVDEPVALFFGIVRPYKGLRFAIEALAELRTRGKTVHLLVAGEFWEDVMVYTQLIEQLGLLAQVKIYNRYIPDEEVGLHFSAADVFIAPYVGGAQSGAVKMALGFDLPVVISRAIASEELENDVAHRLYWVDPKDVRALADAIERSVKESVPASAPATLSSGSNEWEELATVIESLA